MAVIVVLDDDAETRRALVEQLEHLFPRARVIPAATDASLEGIDVRDAVVLTGVAVAERIARRTSRSALRVIALTPEMGPATLMKAEAAGVHATLRSPATAEGLRVVLGPMVGDATS